MTGDHWRHQGSLANVPNESRVFLGLNRGKRSVALDAWSERGGDLARRLAAEADVVVLNYRPGVAHDLRLDYESVSATNPTVIYAEITAFGHNGPYSHRGGFDLLSQASAGVMGFEARPRDGTPSGVRSFAPADLTTAMFNAFGIVNALYRRLVTGSLDRPEGSGAASRMLGPTVQATKIRWRFVKSREGILPTRTITASIKRRMDWLRSHV